MRLGANRDQRELASTNLLLALSPSQKSYTKRQRMIIGRNMARSGERSDASSKIEKPVDRWPRAPERNDFVTIAPPKNSKENARHFQRRFKGLKLELKGNVLELKKNKMQSLIDSLLSSERPSIKVNAETTTTQVDNPQ